MNLGSYILFVCLLIVTVTANAQQRMFRTWSVEQGLPQSLIYDIEEDADGFVWMATYGGGIVRFDGHGFVVFDEESGMPGMKIRDLAFADNGDLFAASEDQGIIRYRDGKFEKLKFDRPVKWVKSIEGGTFAFSGNDIYAVDESGNVNQMQSFKSKIVKCFSDKVGVVMQLETGEIYLYRNAIFSRVNELGVSIELLGFQDQNLCFRQGIGLFRLSLEEEKPVSLGQVRSDDNIGSIRYDEDGAVWIATNGSGVIRLTDKREQWADKNGMLSGTVTCIFKDSRGNHWFGTEGGGVSKFIESPYRLYDSDNGLSNSRVMTVCGKDDEIFVGTLGGGLFKVADGRVIKERRLKSDLILSSCTDEYGQVWVGTVDGQLWVYTEHKWKKVSQLPHRLVNLCYSGGNVWVSPGESGVLAYDVTTRKEVKIKGDRPYGIFDMEARDGTVWFAGNGSAVWKCEGDSFHVVGAFNSHEKLLCVTSDSTGLWFGTDGHGLLRYTWSDERLVRYGRKEGLKSNFVYQLGIDSEQALWVGTQKGMTIATIEKDTIIRFTALNSDESNLNVEPNLNAFYVAQNGGVWIGNIRGLVQYDYSQIKENRVKPTMVLESVQMLNEDASSYNGLFQFDENQLTFNYTGISFEEPAQVVYRLKLEPRVKTWSKPTKERKIIYGNLAPGSYKLKLQAKYRGQEWGDRTVDYAFTITPPYWETTWFYLLVGFSVVSLVAFIIKYRDARTRKRQQLLEQQVDARTLELVNKNTLLEEAKNEALEAQQTEEQFLASISHEMRTPMNAILGMTNLLMDHDLEDEVADRLKNIKFSADNLLSLVNDVLDISKLKSGEFRLQIKAFDFIEMISGLEETFKVRSMDSDVIFRVSVSGTVPRDVRSARVRIYQILQNLLDNAFKFTSEGEIKLSVDADDERLTMAISDSGRGISKHDKEKIFEKFKQVDHDGGKQGVGLGLAITKTLVTLLQGDISVESELGQGTTFTVTIPYELATDTDVIARRVKVDPSLKILIAEDNLLNREVISGFLDKFGVLDYVFADNGLHVLELLDQREFELILMDINMPKMDGVEATRIIRRRVDQWYSNVRIIGLSAYFSENEDDRFKKEGFDNYLSKPFNPNKLKELLAEIKGLPEVEMEAEITEESGDKHIDLSMLQQFGDASVGKRIVKSFVGSVAENLSELKEAFESSDFAKARKILHDLKTNVQYFGISEATPLLESLSNFAKQELTDEAHAIVEKLIGVIELASVELKRYLEDNE